MSASAVVLSILLAAGAVLGQPASPPTAAVLLLPGGTGTPEERARLNDALTSAALRHSGPGQAWTLLGVNLAGAARGEGEVLAEVGKKIDEGKQAYRYLKLDKAQSVFQEAATLLKLAPPARCDRKAVSELYLYWARASLDGGDEKGAGLLLSQIARFDPKAGPDPATMPPNLVAAWDVAQEMQNAKPKTKLTLGFWPGSGTLYLDCDPKAAGVVDWQAAAGDEVLLAAQIEGGSFRARLTVPAGSGSKLQVWSGQPGESARLQDAWKRLERQKPGSPGARKEVDGIADGLKARLLILAEQRPSAEGAGMVNLALYLPGKGIQGTPVELPLISGGQPDPDVLAGSFDGLAKSAGSPTVLAALSAAPKGGSTAGSTTPPAPDKEDLRDDDDGGGPGAAPWYKTWWFWTAVGAVVAGGVVTGVLLGTSGGESGPSGQVILTILPPR